MIELDALGEGLNGLPHQRFDIVADMRTQLFGIECTSCCVDGGFEVFDVGGEFGALRHDIGEDGFGLASPALELFETPIKT